MTRSFFGRDDGDAAGPTDLGDAELPAPVRDAALQTGAGLSEPVPSSEAGEGGPAAPPSPRPRSRGAEPGSAPSGRSGGFWRRAPGFGGPRPQTHERDAEPSLLAELTRRLQALERRSATTEPDGGKAAVLGARLDGVERDLATVAAVVGEALSAPSETPLRGPSASARPDRESGAGAQAVAVLEETVARVARRIEERDARMEAQALQAREGLRALRLRLDRLEAQGLSPDTRSGPSSLDFDMARLMERVGRLESAPPADAAVLDAALSPLMHRLEETQQRTLDSLQGLEGSLTGLEGLVGRMAAADLGRAAERGAATAVAEPVGATFDRADDAPDHVEAALRELSDQVAAIDHRSAAAINQMGHEVIRLAQSLDGRVDEVERRSGERAAEVGGEMARLAHVVEDRLTQADEARAEALERLGARIASVALQLADRIAAAEQRSAQGVATGLRAATEQLHRAAYSLNASRERTERELDEQMRAGEERAARLLAEARGASAAASPSVRTKPAGGETLQAPGAAAPPAAQAPLRRERSSGPAAGRDAPDEATRAAMEAIAAGVGAFHDVHRPRGGPAGPGSAPREPAPSPRPTTQRELIEAARAAARDSAEAGQRPQTRSAGALTSPDGSDVLTLRSRFALPLRKRREG